MRPERAQAFAQGMIAGLCGHLVVAVYFMVANLVEGRSPFHTAALLGQAFFYGLEDPSGLAIGPGPVLAYNGLHLLVFLVLGTVAAWLVLLAERGPEFWYIALVVFIFILFHMFGAFLLVTEPIRAMISAWTVLGAGVAADAAMATYLLWAHPRLRRELRHSGA